jgi:hypothetical protein
MTAGQAVPVSAKIIQPGSGRQASDHGRALRRPIVLGAQPHGEATRDRSNLGVDR